MFRNRQRLSSVASILRSVRGYGGEYRRLVRLGLPVMVTQLGIIIVSFADTMMVARAGTDELGAAAFVNAVFMVAIVMQFGFAAGLTPLVGALYSRNDAHGAGAMMRAGLVVNLAVSLAFTAILGGVYFLLPYFGQPPELLPLIRPYYLTILATLVPMAVFNAFQQTSNGCTDTASPMWFILMANAINIFGNWLLIEGNLGMPRLGLTGAGAATLAARVACALGIVCLYLLSRKRRPYMEGFVKADGARAERCRKVWLTGYPVMIQSGVECLLWSFGGVVSGWYGTVQLASYQVVNTVAQLGFMTYMSLGVAASIRVANLTGLKDWRGVERTASAALHLILLMAFAASVVFSLFFHPLVKLFTPDEAVYLACVPLLLPLVLYQMADATQLTYVNCLRGTSKVKPMLWIAVVCYVVAGIPAMLLLASVCGLHNVGVYYSFSVALMLAAYLFRKYFLKAVEV